MCKRGRSNCWEWTFASVHITNTINLGEVYGNEAHTAGVCTCVSESKAQHTHIHRPVALKDDVAFECERSKLHLISQQLQEVDLASTYVRTTNASSKLQ